ncbi:MAG: hypothetical protein KKH01_02050 [Firmicutes bacterium]|nr:hypothetical protein [Bacillota bacterium]
MILAKLLRSEIKNYQLDLDLIKLTINKDQLKISGQFNYIFGFGEKYNAINQKGHHIENKVSDQFCNQNEKTYFPLPFFFLKEGLGILIHTRRVFEFSLENDIDVDFSKLEDDLVIYVFTGKPKDMISDFMELTGETLLPPKWAFGPWMSAHRWNKQAMIEEQLTYSIQYRLPMTTLVIEQWSDEATFYAFNQSKYAPKKEGLKSSDILYDKEDPWYDPQKMIDMIHQQGIKLILWQTPVIKALESHEPMNAQHELDQQYVIEHDLICKKQDQSIYTIPEGRWFPGSMIPDFSNQSMKNWWFNKRQYLLDMGVDGFKTDGGEFIYSDDIVFSSNLMGRDMINQYSKDYIKAYHEFSGHNRVLFSRAGYLGQQSNTIQWAGDQKSTWKEFQAVYQAGINASLSGQTFWGFDIGGFAGDLPSMELYLRGTEFAVFTPIMQFHSEPIGGQFALLDASKIMNNERTPWNMMKHYNREDLLHIFQSYYWMRMNLLPYIYSESIKAVRYKTTLMKHLMIEYPDDPLAYEYHHQYLFGHLLVAPVIEENQYEQDIYFPAGEWKHLLNDQTYSGNKIHHLKTTLNDIQVFAKKGSALVLNLGENQMFPSDVGNQLDNDTLTVILYGVQGRYHYMDNHSDCFIDWKEGSISVSGDHNKTFVFVHKNW